MGIASHTTIELTPILTASHAQVGRLVHLLLFLELIEPAVVKFLWSQIVVVTSSNIFP